MELGLPGLDLVWEIRGLVTSLSMLAAPKVQSTDSLAWGQGLPGDSLAWGQSCPTLSGALAISLTP